MAVIEACGLGKQYGDKHAVRDLSFRLEPGCVTGFLGPNGAGKSTTIRLMLGLDNGAGCTLFDGRRYVELPDPVRRVGALLDGTAFHPNRTARNHLRMVAAGSRLPARRADEVLEQVGLSAAAGGRPKSFSLGMKQRLGLATALIGRPDTLILDEPGNGMDPQGLRWLRDFLRRYADEGNTAFVSSHLLSTVESIADRVVVIGRGRLLADSALADFVSSHNLETVQARTDEPDRLAEAVQLAGGVVQHRTGDRLTVSGLTTRQVAQVAAVRGCLVVELFTTTATLEEAFMEASATSVEFAVAGAAA